MGVLAHGTHSRYVKGCRCDDCRRAKATYERRARFRRYIRTPLPDWVAHGSNSTYVNWGCRCPACSDAHRRAG